MSNLLLINASVDTLLCCTNLAFYALVMKLFNDAIYIFSQDQNALKIQLVILSSKFEHNTCGIMYTTELC